jgi:glycosyltransferase involved in cell wall biosynthesis
VGSLQVRKAQHVALHALATVAHKFSTVDLHLVGGHTDSGYGAELVALSKSLGLESRVHFWGHRKIYEPFLIHADVVLQTSIAEGVSRVLRESAFLGKPIIATDISGSRECLGDDGCWFTTPGSHPSLALVLEQVLNERPSWIKRGKAAQARYRELFSQDRYESDLGRIIQRLQVRWSGPS